MRELTTQERAKFERLQGILEEVLEEQMPVLADFAARLELPDPALMVNEPNKYLGAVDEFMKDQVIRPEDLDWIMVRIAYFIGELLVQEFGGLWFIDDIPDSRFFLRCVVGEFPSVGAGNAMVDPFDAADFYLSQPPGRSLSKLVGEIREGLAKLPKEP